MKGILQSLSDPQLMGLLVIDTRMDGDEKLTAHHFSLYGKPIY